MDAAEIPHFCSAKIIKTPPCLTVTPVPYFNCMLLFLLACSEVTLLKWEGLGKHLVSRLLYWGEGVGDSALFFVCYSANVHSA